MNLPKAKSADSVNWVAKADAIHEGFAPATELLSLLSAEIEQDGDPAGREPPWSPSLSLIALFASGTFAWLLLLAAIRVLF